MSKTKKHPSKKASKARRKNPPARRGAASPTKSRAARASLRNPTVVRKLHLDAVPQEWGPPSEEWDAEHSLWTKTLKRDLVHGSPMVYVPWLVRYAKIRPKELVYWIVTAYGSDEISIYLDGDRERVMSRDDIDLCPEVSGERIVWIGPFVP